MIKNKNIDPGSIIFQVCNHTFQIIFTIMCIYPFYYIFINSVSDPSKAETIDVFYFLWDSP